VLRFGAVKVYAWRLLRGQPIPLFRDNRDNRAVDRHVDRIKKARTRRRRDGSTS
jgi:hypothetical protein